MKIVMLGTGGFLPMDTAQTACYFLPEVGVMLDAGHGLYRLPAYLKTNELDIYLSHAHADHTSGLDYLFASYFKADLLASGQTLNGDNLQGFLQRSNESLPRTRIHADPPTLKVVAPKYVDFHYTWQALQPEEILTGDGRLSHFPLETGSTGFRLDWPGHSLAYVTDVVASPEAAYVEKIAGVDLLLHDCYTPDRLSVLAGMIGHSHLSAVMQVADRAQVRKLVLIHHSPIETLDYRPDLAAARKAFPKLSIEMAYDEMQLEF